MKPKQPVFTLFFAILFVLLPVTDLFYVMNFGSAGCMALSVGLRHDRGSHSLFAAVVTALLILAAPHP